MCPVGEEAATACAGVGSLGLVVCSARVEDTWLRRVQVPLPGPGLSGTVLFCLFLFLPIFLCGAGMEARASSR